MLYAEHAENNGEIFAEDMSFDTENFDCKSKIADKEYRKKVYEIATKDFKNLEVSDNALKIFLMRERNCWNGPDSVYDAWLISSYKTRAWFPWETFI